MNIRERPDQPVRVKITIMVKGAVVFSRAYDEDSAKEGGKLHDFFSSIKVCTVESRFKKARFKKESRFKKDCCYIQPIF